MIDGDHLVELDAARVGFREYAARLLPEVRNVGLKSSARRLNRRRRCRSCASGGGEGNDAGEYRDA
ncbi:MAG: hypothetical protein ACREVI_10905 [Steroidobacteraceae bacterium]